MNSPVTGLAAAVAALVKADPNLPAFVVTGRQTIAIRAGTVFSGHTFAEETAVPIPGGGFRVGSDLVIAVGSDGSPHMREAKSLDDCRAEDVLGGFHYAPGGNAVARAGGDDVPAINPFSLWDVAFRPACPDPRGMTLVEGPAGQEARSGEAATGKQKFWADIYLCAADHLAGTSRHGATIADGNDRPEKPEGGKYGRFDYEAAKSVMAHHGKGLLSLEEFFAAAYGVTEKTAVGNDPSVTKLDAVRTSKWGLIQATGNLWVWGHDGDPDTPRASLFGGSWLRAGYAGSRYADVGRWPEVSGDLIGSRGRCDHLQPV